MHLPNILKTKSTDFVNKSVSIRKINNGLELNILPEEMNFQELTKRRQPVAPETILENLEKDGHIFANVGISVILTTKYLGDDYLISTMRKGDMISPICGYVPASKLENPVEVMDEEIAEEFLPVTGGGRVLTGKREDKILSRPYADAVEYDPNNLFHVSPKDDGFNLRGIFKGDVRTVDSNTRTIKECSGMYFASAFNTAQFVLKYSTDIPQNLDPLNLTLIHAEDEFNPAKNILEAKPVDNGLPLIRISRGDITAETFLYRDGSLQTYEIPDAFVTQSFVPKERGVVSGRGMKLSSYLSI